MSDCLDNRTTFLPEAVLKALMNLPALRYMKAPVDTVAQLYEKYPTGNEKGTFAYVLNDNAFYAYHPRGWYPGEWKPLSNESTSSFFDINTDFVKESDILVYDSTKQKFVVKSGSIWNKLIGDLKDSFSQVGKFLSIIDDLPTEEDISGVYFINNTKIKGLYLVINKNVVKIFNSSDWYTKKETIDKLNENKEYIDSEVDNLNNSLKKVLLDQSELWDKINSGKNDKKGTFTNEAAINKAYPTPESNWEAYNLETRTIWVVSNGKWIDSKSPISGILEEFSIIYNPEYAFAIVDQKENIFFAIRWDTSIYSPYYNIDTDTDTLAGILKYQDNPEYAFAIVDQKENIFFAIRWDTSIYSPYYDFETLLAIVKYQDDNEGRLARTVDAIGQVIEAIEKDGTKYIAKLKADSINIDRLSISDEGLKDLNTALRRSGYFGKFDQTDQDLIQLPLPSNISFMNIETPKLPTTKTDDYEAVLEYWDMYGNYWKKDIILNAQGNSTIAYVLKNLSFDMADGAKVQFGNWVAADSYHLKMHYTDAFRGESTLCYRYMKDITNTRPFGSRNPFDYQKRANGFASGIGDVAADMAGGANYIADGLPVALYHNGVFHSIANVTQKKHRDNFDMDRNSTEHIWLDGVINTGVLWGGTINWHAFELRNPKPKKWTLIDINGAKYDTDNPIELSDKGNSGVVKKNIQAFGKSYASMQANADKAIFDKLFFEDNLHDYMIFSNVLYNFDGFDKNWQWYTKDGKRWAVSVHDCDLMFGKFWRSNVIMVDEVQSTILGNSEIHPTYWAKRFYPEKFNARYKQLRDAGIVSTEYFVNKLNAWLDTITYPILKMDLKKWNFPSYRASGTDTDNWLCIHMDRLWSATLWDKTTEYKKGDRVYVQTSEARYVFRALKDNQNKPPILKQTSDTAPLYLGFYESVDRVRQFLDMRIALLDDKWEYNK